MRGTRGQLHHAFPSAAVKRVTGNAMTGNSRRGFPFWFSSPNEGSYPLPPPANFLPMEQTYYRKGFGLKAEVAQTLAADYDGRLVDLLRQRDYALTAGDVTVRLAHEFGFCYGVERAVDYAYQTRRKFPDRRIFLLGEII